ncbi:MAG: cryptochrome/photolyase family protein [Cyclobacteriaceae bacterium]|nr:cryptochrome/photolyase family protein [Cyclobacteriaceae bacterium HetDA_MAG_MS6]
MPFKRLALILGNCLFPNHHRLKPDQETLFFIAEDKSLCTHFKYHKHKLVLFLSAMRSHADQLRKDWEVVYKYLDYKKKQESYEDKLLATLKHYEITEIVTYVIEDHFFNERIKNFCQAHQITLEVVESPAFMTTQAEYKVYERHVKKPFMHTFYQWQRRRLDILIDEEDGPIGGKWSFDEENRKKLPKGVEIPKIPSFDTTVHTKDVKELVDQLFPDHPGKTENFQWATTREQVLELVKGFLKSRFQQFGPYEDAIHDEKAFLFHSVLSPYLNMGLITPEEIVDDVLAYAEEQDIHFPSVEGFIRQVVGWREFVRGVYRNHEEALRGNFFDHTRKMKSCWYTGGTGIPPLDDSIKKAIDHGYTHHIERLMILGNIMLLCEIHPDVVYQWFMEMYVDSADWVMVPNVYGMSQYADGGIFATKPYIGGSNYILKMSNYRKKGDWSEILNGLYWRFIANNRSMFESNPRMSMMTSTLDRMSDDKRSRIFDLAETFIEKVTYQ